MGMPRSVQARMASAEMETPLLLMVTVSRWSKGACARVSFFLVILSRPWYLPTWLPNWSAMRFWMMGMGSLLNG